MIALRDFIPPVLVKLAASLKSSRYGWSGDYPDWSSAMENATGYDQSGILEKVRAATQKVVNGDAVYERDSVLFDHIQYSWPTLAALLWSAAQHAGQLRVADIGGSLGSSYFQNRKFLKGLTEVKWAVVEQPHFAACGQKEFQNENLLFFSELEMAWEKVQPNVVLLSSVLPYVEKPRQLLEEIAARKPDMIIVDNMPFSTTGRNRIMLQRVDPSIYSASYPCHILMKEEIVRPLQQHYQLVESFVGDLAIHIDGKRVSFEGLIFSRVNG